jgi:CubicO group peptidase (beta-lactamase class C family)
MTEPVQDRYEWLIGHLRAGTFDERAAEEGFDPSLLAVVPAAPLVDVMASIAPALLGEPASTKAQGRSLEVQDATVITLALVEEAEPYRFAGLQFHPNPESITDARLREPPWTVEGDASRIENALREEFRAQDMVGVVAAGSDDGSHTQQCGRSRFADLDAGMEVQSQQPMLAGSIVKLLTATAALHLVGEGLIRVDDSANRYLQSLRLESDTVGPAPTQSSARSSPLLPVVRTSTSSPNTS